MDPRHILSQSRGKTHRVLTASLTTPSLLQLALQNDPLDLAIQISYEAAHIFVADDGCCRHSCLLLVVAVSAQPVSCYASDCACLGQHNGAP